jgi:uncharacterized metal-binding protein YceD (DUF177 family)
MECPLDWNVELKDIGEREKRVTRTATASECAALASVLDLITCDRLVAAFTVRSKSLGCYRMYGSLEADLVQACIVSLEPVPAHIEEDFDVEYRPAELIEREDGTAERAILEGRDVEPIEGHRLDAGRIVFEHLSAALDPYPRKEGAEFHWVDKEPSDRPESDNPFAVLKSLSLDPGEKGKKK